MSTSASSAAGSSHIDPEDEIKALEAEAEAEVRARQTALLSVAAETDQPPLEPAGTDSASLPLEPAEIPTPIESKEPVVPKPEPVTGNLAAALAGGATLTPSQLWTQELENKVSTFLGDLEPEQFEKLCEEAKAHPEFQSYVDGVRAEIGDDTPWEFGQDEPYEDILGFGVWCRARANMQQALGLPPAQQVTSAPAEDVIVPTPHTTFFNPPAPKAAIHPAAAKPPAVEPKAAMPTPVEPKAALPTPAPAPVEPKATMPAPQLPPQPAMPGVAPTPLSPQAVDPQAPPAPNQLSATVDAAAKAAAVTAAEATSVTHRNEYMQFLRAARNPKKLPQSLVATFNGQKLDLFRMWLERGQDFSQVEVEINRRNVQASIASAKDKYMSRSELTKDGRYSKEDIDLLVQARTTSGDWVPDTNFPDREDLRKYRVGNFDVEKETQHRREDSQQIASTTGVSATEALMLTEEGADFASGTTPSIFDLCGGTAPTSTGGEPAAKSKGKAKAKPKAKPAAAPNGEPQPDKPLTPLQKANLLKKSVFLDH